MYTPVDLEQVMKGSEHIQHPVEMTVGSVTMQVELMSQSQARIVRLISPNAEDYLNPAYAPGTIIQFGIV